MIACHSPLSKPCINLRQSLWDILGFFFFWHFTLLEVTSLSDCFIACQILKVMDILVSENQNTLNFSQPSTFSSHTPQCPLCPALYVSSLTMSGQDHQAFLTSPVQVMVNWYCAYSSIPMRRRSTKISEVNIMDNTFCTSGA